MKINPEFKSPNHGGCTFIAKRTEDPAWAFCNEKVRGPGESWCQRHRRVVFTRVRPVAPMRHNAALARLP